MKNVYVQQHCGPSQRLYCTIPVIPIDIIAWLKTELADVFLYPHSHNCMSNSNDWLLAKVANVNHHPRGLISQKSSQIGKLVWSYLALWCECANTLPIRLSKCIFFFFLSIGPESHTRFQFLFHIAINCVQTDRTISTRHSSSTEWICIVYWSVSQNMIYFFWHNLTLDIIWH